MTEKQYAEIRKWAPNLIDKCSTCGLWYQYQFSHDCGLNIRWSLTQLTVNLQFRDTILTKPEDILYRVNSMCEYLNKNNNKNNIDFDNLNYNIQEHVKGLKVMAEMSKGHCYEQEEHKCKVIEANLALDKLKDNIELVRKFIKEEIYSVYNEN
jgi:hypothetical protein